MKRIKLLLLRNIRARKYGIRYGRAKGYTMPTTLIMHDKKIKLYFPDENGVRVAFVDIFLDDCYGLTRLKQEKIRTILDIGANIGLFSLAARAFFPDGMIHAYEPNPRLMPYLSHQAAVGKISYFSEAVGKESGQVSLQDCQDSVMGAVMDSPTGQIPKIAFETAIQRLGGEVDLLKLDCEGAEWDIFRERVSFKKVRFMSLEYHLMAQHTHQEIVEVVQNLGFKIFCQIPSPVTGILQAFRK